MKKHWFTTVSGIIVVAALGIAIHACSGGGGGSNGGTVTGTVTLSGTISGDYTVAMSRSDIFYAKALSLLGFATPAFAVVEAPEVDKILALPMDRGSLNSWNMENSIAKTINSDGTFSLSLSQAHDWLLVLIHSSSTGTTGQYVGSIAVRTSASDSLLNIPATNAANTILSLGTFTRDTTTNDALSSKAVTTADFKMTADQLSAMAKTDDIFRNAMNIVNNYGNTGFGNGGKDWYMLRPDFSWIDSSATLTIGFPDPNQTMNYQGMSFQLDTNTTTVSMDDICATAGTVAFYPPENILLGGTSYGPGNPVINSGECQFWNDGPARETSTSEIYASDAYENKITYSIIKQFIPYTIPPGPWFWKEKGVTKAAFEIANINPPVTSEGKLKGFMPSFKVNVEAETNKILSVDVKWYYFNGVAYVELTDKAVLKHFISSAEVKFDVTSPTNNARTTCEMYFDPIKISTVKPADFIAESTGCGADWYYGDSTKGTNTGVMGFYESGGFGYFITYPPQPQQR